MIGSAPIVAITLRGLLDRRRTWLMLLLAAVPVLVAVVIILGGNSTFSERPFDRLIIRTVLPLIALIFGTAAIGAELDDGTVVYLLTKPIRRFRLVLAKSSVAAGLTIALVVPATLLTGLVGASVDADIANATVAFAIAAAIGGTAYALAFLTLSTFTSRALAVGLGYVMLWEGVLSGLFEGTRLFSIRQATLGLAAQLQGTESPRTLDGTSSLVVLGVVILGSLALASWRLSRFQLRGGD
ncbi:MAG: ABC transporter permease subunit [Chloroflexota bacterium]